MLDRRHFLRLSLLSILSITLGCVSYLVAGEIEKKKTGDAGPEAAGREFRLPVYRPPNLGAPGLRVGGGTRSINQLFALAPQHVGLTTSGHPRLYWFVSTGETAKIRFTLAAKPSNENLVDLIWETSAKEGIDSIDLSKHNVELKNDTTYRWAVSLTSEQGIMPETLSSQGFVQRVNVPKLERISPEEMPFAAAQAGLWYDALQSLSVMIDEEPRHSGLRKQRAALLDQVGLKAAARHDRSSNGR